MSECMVAADPTDPAMLETAESMLSASSNLLEAGKSTQKVSILHKNFTVTRAGLTVKLLSGKNAFEGRLYANKGMWKNIKCFLTVFGR